MSAASPHTLIVLFIKWAVLLELQKDNAMFGSSASKDTEVSVGDDKYLLKETTRIEIIRTEQTEINVTQKIISTFLCVLILTLIMLAVKLKKSFKDSMQLKAEIPKKRPATPIKFVIEENKE